MCVEGLSNLHWMHFPDVQLALSTKYLFHIFILNAMFFFEVSSPMPMWMLNMPIIVWIFILVISTTQPVYLQINCAILKSHKYILYVPFEQHAFMRQCFMGGSFACRHCRNLLENSFLLNPCFQLCTSNLIVVLKTINIAYLSFMRTQNTMGTKEIPEWHLGLVAPLVRRSKWS